MIDPALDVSSEDANSATNVLDAEISNRAKKYDLMASKKGAGLSLAAEKLKNYAGLGSDESDTETYDLSDGSETRLSTPKLVMEKKISGLKEIVYSKSDWIKIIKDNDLETTPHAEMYASLRHGIPSEL